MQFHIIYYYIYILLYLYVVLIQINKVKNPIDSSIVVHEKMELQTIHNKIYEIRGQKVMLDRDLAEMYGVQTRALNQAVKRNKDRFPNDFMFQLTENEMKNWISQTVMTNAKSMGVRRRSYAFTELGVAMLSSVLHSPTAIQINMGIMRAFAVVRQVLSNLSPESEHLLTLQKDVHDLKKYIEEVFTDYNFINEDTRMQIELINETLAELQERNIVPNKSRIPIGFLANQQIKKI